MTTPSLPPRSAPPARVAPLPAAPLRFVRRAQVITLHDVPADRTLLELLREDLGCTGTKEGCGEGDCGACTVVLGELAPQGHGEGQGDGQNDEQNDSAPRLRYRAINSCIRLAHSIDGLALWTAEDIAADQPGFVFGDDAPRCATPAPGQGQAPTSGTPAANEANEEYEPAGPPGDLHPVQQAMVQCHGSQCGFCTPGFVMSLFGLYQQSSGNSGCGGGREHGHRHGGHACAGKAGAPSAPAIPLASPVSRHAAQVALSGNLCRCTGYRPILDAAQTMHAYTPQWVDEPRIAALLQGIQSGQDTGGGENGGGENGGGAADTAYLRPRSLARLLALRQAHPQAQIVAGSTDVGLWITKLHKHFARVLDVTAAPELQVIEVQAASPKTHRPENAPENGAENGRQDTTTAAASGAVLCMGAAVRLSDAFERMASLWPELRTFTQRFAGLPVRNSGTLGGNIANGSPIGDSMPLLIALRASVVLASVRGQRELPLESLYTGYRQNVMAPDEILAWVRVPLPSAQAPRPLLRAYKISKRYDDDISAVCLALNLTLDGGRVAAASIGAGGVAPTPARARQAEAALAGQPWSEATVRAAMRALRAEFQPISDMRASADYRKTVLGNLLWRLWLESQAGGRAPDIAINLEDSRLSFDDALPEGSAA